MHLYIYIYIYIYIYNDENVLECVLYNFHTQRKKIWKLCNTHSRTFSS